MNEKCGPILLVEDNKDDVFFMTRAVKTSAIDHELHVVSDGQAALDYLSGTGIYQDRDKFPLPCLVLLDLKLPIKSGLEVLAWIRKQPKLRTLVTIVLTTSREPSDIATAYDLGVNAYLVKPNDVSVLQDMVAALNRFWFQFNQFPPM
jgi:CheY-like chemotaxis protein